MIRNTTIRKKIILHTILVIVCAVVVSGTYFFYTYYTTLKQEAYDRMDSSISQAVTSISHKFEEIDNTSFAFLANPYMRGWQNRELDFTNDSFSSYNNIANLRSEIESNLMFNHAWLLKYIDSVYMFADGKSARLASRNAESLPQSQQRNEKIFETTKGIKQMSFYYLSDKTVYMIRRMNDVTQSKQLTLIFAINSDSVAQELYQLNFNATANIANNHTIFFSNRHELIGKANSDKGQPQNAYLDETSNFIVYRNLPDDSFSIEISVPKSSITQQVLKPLQYYLFVMIIFIIFFAAIAAFVASIYTKFIRDLNTALNQVRVKNYDVVLPDYHDLDLKDISNTFNNMVSEIKALINKVYISKVLLKDADLKFLQSQMNPHFLVNTLTTISTAALLHKENEIFQMVTALSSILDANLHSENLFVTVEKELEHIKCYLYIQGTRFQDKLKYSIHVESDDLLKLYIPRLSIEPLVENSVIHGIEENFSGGEVTVSIHRDGENVLVTVCDNGKGFDVEKLLQEHGETSKGSHSIGIVNTNKRIKLLFGEQYGIRFESKPFVKTCAYICFPVLTNDERGRIMDDQDSDCRR